MMDGRVSPVMEARFAQDANSLVATLSRRLRAVRCVIACAPSALACSAPTSTDSRVAQHVLMSLQHPSCHGTALRRWD